MKEKSLLWDVISEFWKKESELQDINFEFWGKKLWIEKTHNCEKNVWIVRYYIFICKYLFIYLLLQK